jgi:hypothetical protein
MASDIATNIRRGQRMDVSIRAMLAVSDVHAGAIKLAAPSGVKDGWIECDCVDVSIGGIGFLTTVYYPRLTRLRVKLFGVDETTKPILECECVVRRIPMTDRRPAYHVGCSFGDLDATQQQCVDKLMRSVGCDVE